MKKRPLLFTSIDTTDHVLNYANETLYIHRYAEENIKELVLKAKTCLPTAIRSMAQDLYIYMMNHIYKNKVYSKPEQTDVSILILHAPSTSFIVRTKKQDHMAEALSCIADMHIMHNKVYTKVHIDISPHLFIPTHFETKSQHQKNKEQREMNLWHRFQTLLPLPYTHLYKYDAIYVIDDVVTTGSTLKSLCTILRTGLQKFEEDNPSFCTTHTLPQIYPIAFCH